MNHIFYFHVLSINQEKTTVLREEWWHIDTQIDVMFNFATCHQIAQFSCFAALLLIPQYGVFIGENINE